MLLAALAASAKHLQDESSKSPSTDAYLMVYFTDEDHSLHMAVSFDGYTFTALNDNYAVINGDTIAEQHGVRDPYIMRAPDGTYYMALTDLHIFARKAGFRDTEWERDVKQYAWGNNRNIVLMKSKDLIHWSHSLLRVNECKGFEDIGCAWAPEMLWDEKRQAVMMYWTTRFGRGDNKVYYAYMDKDFTKFVTEPKLIFEKPEGKPVYIDSDIVQGNDGRYYMHYVSYDGGVSGIKLAVADSPTGPYTYLPDYVDQEPKACEAPNCWKRTGTDTYVLMYDCFGIVPPNFGFLETTDFKTYTNIGHFNEEGGKMKAVNFDKPKHGAVTYITKEQARQLLRYWQEHPNHTAKSIKVIEDKPKVAAKPLYRDPIYDGAADPTLIYNKERQAWWMFYTNRRANMEGGRGVEWVHGSPIGIAESTDGGATWRYVQDANINYGRDKNYTYWAPDVIEANGKYHMFLTVVPGIFADWKHPREIVHLESTNLKDWTFMEKCEGLASERVIDASLIYAGDTSARTSEKNPEDKAGEWLMFYNNEADGKTIWLAKSKDLHTWQNYGQIIKDRRGEGAKVFRFKGKYWMIVDNWDGMGVYSSDDLMTWKRQATELLSEPGTGPDDGVNGNHADVVVSGDRAFIFYFTHPGRNIRNAPDNYDTRRSSIQVAEIIYENGQLKCERDNPVYIDLRPDVCRQPAPDSDS